MGEPLVYVGTRRADGSTSVTVNGRALAPRADLRGAPTTAFDWGYAGQGAPAQLAIAILADYLGDDIARRHYKHFVATVICRFPHQAWTLSGSEIAGTFE